MGEVEIETVRKEGRGEVRRGRVGRRGVDDDVFVQHKVLGLITCWIRQIV